MKEIFRNPLFYLCIIYLLVPVDFVPDAVPVAGTLDDLLTVILALIMQTKISSKK